MVFFLGETFGRPFFSGKIQVKKMHRDNATSWNIAGTSHTTLDEYWEVLELIKYLLDRKDCPDTSPYLAEPLLLICSLADILRRIRQTSPRLFDMIEYQTAQAEYQAAQALRESPRDYTEPEKAQSQEPEPVQIIEPEPAAPIELEAQKEHDSTTEQFTPDHSQLIHFAFTSNEMAQPSIISGT
jgi:hypothetical protein